MNQAEVPSNIDLSEINVAPDHSEKITKLIIESSDTLAARDIDLDHTDTVDNRYRRLPTYQIKTLRDTTE